MRTSDKFDSMTEACIDLHAEIMLHGSSEMQTASRLLLYALGKETQRRAGDTAKHADNEN